MGAKKGKGKGMNELYLTHPEDGTLQQVPKHGLQKYLTLSTRVSAKLKHSNGADLIFVGTSGSERKDRNTNSHRMFYVLKSGLPPYFIEFPGPWTNSLYYATCAVTADINGDGLDDLIVCNKKGKSRMYIQTQGGVFRQMNIPSNEYTNAGSYWRNVRFEYLTNNTVRHKYLVVVEGTSLPSDKATSSSDSEYYVRLYRGRNKAPYFNFNKPYYSKRLPYGTYDVEVLDVNNDGVGDLYISQSDEFSGYCSLRGPDAIVWKGGPTPPPAWIPPYDKAAADILLMGIIKEKDNQLSFLMHEMDFRTRGCSSLVKRFGNMQTLALAGGRHIHEGYNYLLEWDINNTNNSDGDKEVDNEIDNESSNPDPVVPRVEGIINIDNICRDVGLFCSSPKVECCGGLICKPVGINTQGNLIRTCINKPPLVLTEGREKLSRAADNSEQKCTAKNKACHGAKNPCCSPLRCLKKPQSNVARCTLGRNPKQRKKALRRIAHHKGNSRLLRESKT